MCFGLESISICFLKITILEFKNYSIFANVNVGNKNCYMLFVLQCQHESVSEILGATVCFTSPYSF